VLLVLAGGYMVVYWAGNLTAEPGETTTTGPVRFVDDLSGRASDWVQDMGWQPIALALGAVLGAVLAAAFVAAFVAAHTARRAPAAVDRCCPPDADDDASDAEASAVGSAPLGAATGDGGLTFQSSRTRTVRSMTTQHDPRTLVRSISRDELAARLGEITPVEALSPTDFAQGHLPGAVNLPARQVDDLAPRQLPGKDAPLAVYCTNAACRNSSYVAHRLAGLGYTNVYHYAGGKQDWHQAGLPTEPGTGP
jgi:rhodanese-related sulfurtransferase